jgi:ribosomal protein S18 acetylase RimI-like enzyme
MIDLKIEKLGMHHLLLVEDLSGFKLDAMRKLMARKVGKVTGFVAVDDKLVVGVLIAQEHNDITTIISLVVDEKYRRNHIGTLLIEKLLCSQLEYQPLMYQAVVDELNLITQKFLYSLGFRATHLIKGYFGDNHDAIEFIYMVEGDEKKQLTKKRKARKSKTNDE